MWQFKELRDLGTLHGAQRSAGFLWQLSKAEQKCPLGFLSTLPAICYTWAGHSLMSSAILFSAQATTQRLSLCAYAQAHGRAIRRQQLLVLSITNSR